MLSSGAVGETPKARLSQSMDIPSIFYPSCVAEYFSAAIKAAQVLVWANPPLRGGFWWQPGPLRRTQSDARGSHVS
jgi:hypothetical protein